MDSGKPGGSIETRIPVEAAELEGELEIPAGARGVVLFAHGSGSSRFSPRNRMVAGKLREGKIGTLLIDLLTRQEEEVDLHTGHLRFDLDLLALRILAAAEWLRGEQRTETLTIGCFGASTGGGAALVAAARRPDLISAVVSRGGRPDLAGEWIPRVEAPSLLIVGGEDVQVLELNREALGRLRAERKLEVIPGATHLFEEPGALEAVAGLARQWFAEHLAGPVRSRHG